MYIFISILILVISVLLGLIVLVQNPKGGGLAANFTGSGSQFMGVRQTADFLEKATWSLAVALLVLSLTATMIIPRGTESLGPQDSELKDQINNVNTNTPVDFQPLPAQNDDDGSAEVIFTSWAEKGSHATGKLHILSALGVPLHEVFLPDAHGSPDWNGAMAAPTLDNIDGDADLELVINTAHSGFVSYDMPDTDGARVLWGTGRGGYRRAGVAEPRVLFADGFESGLMSAWSDITTP